NATRSPQDTRVQLNSIERAPIQRRKTWVRFIIRIAQVLIFFRTASSEKCVYTAPSISIGVIQGCAQAPGSHAELLGELVDALRLRHPVRRILLLVGYSIAMH